LGSSCIVFSSPPCSAKENYYQYAMGVLQHVTSTGYGYVAPTLDKARTYVPMLDSTVQRIEPHIPLLIQKVDGHIDAGYAVVERNTVGVRGTVSAVHGKVIDIKTAAHGKVFDFKTATNDKAQRIMNENQIFLRVHQTGLSLVESTESLIDRLLPPPAALGAKEDGKDGEEETLATQALIPRAMVLPFRIPARTIHITLVKANGMTSSLKDVIVVKAQWVVELTQDQKAKLSAYIAHNSRQLMDKASSSTVVVRLQKGRAEGSRKLQVARESIAIGQQQVVDRVYIVGERLRIQELKDVTISAAKSATQTAHAVTKRVAGEERATVIFTKIGEKVPAVKSVIFPQAETGAAEELDEEEEEKLVEHELEKELEAKECEDKDAKLELKARTPEQLVKVKEVSPIAPPTVASVGGTA